MTVLGHIVSKQLSRERENTATEALAFILQSSELARHGLMKMLLSINPDLPSLRFRTQQAEENVRPDMWGVAGGQPYAFVENKFWAGLTDHQPVEYLRILAGHCESSVLLVVVPAARQDTIWRELLRRLDEAGIDTTCIAASLARVVRTDLGPHLAMVCWPDLLATIEAEVMHEPHTRADLLQLRGLCSAADSEAFIPLSRFDLTDQRIPAFVLQMTDVVQRTAARGVSEGFVSIDSLRASHSWERVGRYILLPASDGFGAWFGISFRRWQRYGSTPLWVEFPDTGWGRASEVADILEPWAEQGGLLTCTDGGLFCVAVALTAGEELDRVVRDAADQLEAISLQLAQGIPSL